MVSETPDNPNSGDSRLPVCEEWLPRLQQDKQRWLIELARWYESNWQLALSGTPQPSADSVIDLIAPDRKEKLRQVFESIDSRYQSLVKESSAETADFASMDTVDASITDTSLATPSGAPDACDSGQTDRSGVTTPPGDRPTEDDGAALDPTLDYQYPTTNLDHTRTLAKGHTANADPRSSSQLERAVHGGDEAAFSLNASPQIPGYRIKEVLGRGGMGVVFLAHQQSIDRQVALKMIQPRIQLDRVALDRFYAEAKAIGRFQHENIVRIHDAGQHHGMPYFSLEYVDGKSLAEKMDGKPLDPEEVARLMEPMARAIQVAHDAGVIHRDLKPANVLMTRDGVPKITDFGLAKEFEQESELSQDGSVIGTPAFMSPEQAQGASDVGPRADVYGLGALMYSLLTGRPPFQGSQTHDTLQQVIDNDPVEPIRLQPGVPKDLDTICLKCLQKEPAQRYADARSLADDLARYLRGEPIAARPLRRAERIWRWCRRNPIMAVATGTAAMLALVVMIGGPVSAAVINEQKKEVMAAKQQADQRASEANAARENAASYAQDAALLEQAHFGVLKNLVFEFNGKMAGDTNLIELREDLLETVRNGLLRLEANKNTERPRNMLGASAYFRLGEINLEIGRSERAIEDFQQCERIFKELDAKGQLTDSPHNLSKLYRYLGEAYRGAGDYETAEAYFVRSLEIRRAWDQRSDSPTTKNLLAEALSRLGSLEKLKGNIHRSRELLTEALEVRTKLVEMRPTEDNHNLLLHAKRALSKAVFQEGRTDVALERMSSAVRNYRQRANESPENRTLQVNNAAFHTDLAMMHLYLDRPKTAAETYQYAVDSLTALLAQNLDDAFIRDALSDACYGLLVARRESAEEDDDELISRLLQLRRDSLKLDPNSIAKQGRLACALARCGQLAEGYQWAADIRQTIDPSDPSQYVLACIFAQLVSARTDFERESRSIPASVPTIAQLEQAAIEAIRHEVANGFSRVTDIRLDPDLDPVRELAGFQDVLKSLEQKLAQ